MDPVVLDLFQEIARLHDDTGYGSRWLDRNILDPEIQIFKKNSDLSQKRTAAANLLLDFIMRTEIEKASC